MTETTQRGRLTTAATMLTFALAGSATLTLVSEKTGTRYTYRIRRPKDATPSCPWFVSVMYGPDNETQYAYIGCIYRDRTFKPGRKSNIGADDVRVKAFLYFWGWVAKAAGEPPFMQVWHEGRCCRCGRKLTVPTSVANGIGPECAGKMPSPDFFCEEAAA